MDWKQPVDSLPVAVTVCDRDGVVVAMNHRSVETFAKDGGAALVGSNLLDCHPEPARSRLAELLETAGTNSYTVEKDGRRKLIHQCPWYDEHGRYAGLVELSIHLPLTLPHFVRG